MAQEKEWQEGMPTHENIIFSCFGWLSNTGITNALASFIRTITRLVSNRRHDWNSSDT